MNRLLVAVLLGGLVAAPCVVVAQVHYAPPVRKTAPTVADTVMAPELSPLGDSPDLTPPSILDADDRVYEYVQQMPEFPGGKAALAAWLAEHLRYPTTARQRKVEGSVFVRCVIERTGQVGQATILKGLGYGCNDEAVRLVQALPPFRPGRQNGRPMRVYYQLPVSFRR